MLLMREIVSFKHYSVISKISYLDVMNPQISVCTFQLLFFPHEMNLLSVTAMA